MVTTEGGQPCHPNQWMWQDKTLPPHRDAQPEVILGGLFSFGAPAVTQDPGQRAVPTGPMPQDWLVLAGKDADGRLHCM